MKKSYWERETEKYENSRNF